MKKITIKCPSCHKNITRDDLKYSQNGTMTYDITISKNGEIEYEQDEFLSEGSGEFYHSDCGGEGIDNEEIEKLHINY